MQAGEVRLGIDCGSASTVGVLVWPDGRWVRLLFDGGPQLSSAVHVGGDGALVTGARAWQQALASPEGFVPAPVRRLREGRIPVGVGAVEAVGLVAATLRRVGEEAATVVGGPVADVRLVVPAGWGPRQRTLMRQAAHRAGLGQPIVVEAPVAAAERLLATGTRILVGSFIAVCDFGGGFEATVLRRTPTGFDVLATVDDPDAGGLRIDELLADRVAALTGVPAGGPDPAALSDGERVMLLANVATAKETLAHSASVAVTLPPPRPAVVLDSAQLDAAARPILTEAAGTVQRAVDAAEIDSGQLAGVYCIGGGAATPRAVRVLGEQTGLSPVAVDEPQLAAVLGAAQAHGPADAAGQMPPAAPAVVALPPLRRVARMLVSGLASLALAAHFIVSAELSRTQSRGFYDPNAYVLANWGELAMAAVFALITCLAAATLLASTRDRAVPRRRPPQIAAPAPMAAQTAARHRAATPDAAVGQPAPTPDGAPPPEDADTPPADTAAAVAYWRTKDPTMSVKEICGKVSRSERTVRRILDRLAETTPTQSGPDNRARTINGSAVAALAGTTTSR